MPWLKRTIPTDTGRLDIREDLVNSAHVAAVDRAWIQRTGDRVHLSLYSVAFSADGTVRVLLTLPSGFRPIEREGYSLSIGSTTTREAVVMSTGLYVYQVPTGGSYRISASISWSTADSFPTTYPGVQL